MSQVGTLIGTHRAASAGVLGPAEHPGLEECAIDDQLPASLEQVEQANLTLGPAELVILLHQHPWHTPAFDGQRITGADETFILKQEQFPHTPPPPLPTNPAPCHTG